MGDKSTYELNKILENAKPKDIRSYLADNKEDMKNSEKEFYYFFKDTLDKKRISLKELYISAGVSESYGGKIVRMERHTKNRDLIIRLCLAGHFNLIETNRALELYKMSPLYPRFTRDACIIIAINNRKYDISEVDDILAEQREKPLSREREAVLLTQCSKIPL